MRPLEAGDRTIISGELGNLLNMNFDAITLFGLLFSLRLNAALGSNEASIFADTILLRMLFVNEGFLFLYSVNLSKLFF